MRCSSATKKIGPFIDGELTEKETRALREHLESCGECSQRLALTRGLVRELASLPTIVPTPEESYRLANVLRRKMAQPLAPSRVYSRGQLAAAAFSALVLATVTGVSLAVWSGGSPVTVTEETSSDEVAVGKLTEPGSEPGTESAAGETVETGARWPPWPALPWWPLGPSTRPRTSMISATTWEHA